MTPSEQTCYISLGGNQGDVASVFEQALEQIGQISGIRLGQVSPHYRTTAVGSDAGDEYLNSAAELFTTLSPLEVLRSLQEVETHFGRTRPYRWAPRTLDLDLIFHGNEVLVTDVLMLPHPAAWYRRFVLAPLADIAPDVVHPLQILNVSQLLEHVQATHYKVALLGGASNESDIWDQKVKAVFPKVELVHWDQPEAQYNMQVILNNQIEREPKAQLTLDMTEMEPKSQLQSLIDILTAVRGHVERV